MSKHIATVSWSRNGQTFINNNYKRTHQWKFDGGQTIRASASPNIVPEPLSDPTAVDPEEAFVASLSSCHMLWFLSIAAKEGFVIEQYEDRAEGILKKNKNGKKVITKVTLFPKVTYKQGTEPSVKQDRRMHRQADNQCFIANSVKTNVQIESKINKKTDK